MASSQEMTSLAALADLWQTTRTDRLALQKQVDKLEEEERLHKKNLIDRMREADVRAIGGKLGTATLKTKTEPTVDDWDLLYDYVKQHDAFDLLYRRVNALAVRERWEHNEQVAGVQSIEITELSWSKAK